MSPVRQQGPAFGVTWGGLITSKPVPLPAMCHLATSPPLVTRRVPCITLTLSCRGYRPNGLSRRVRIPARLPTPKPSCRGRRSRAQRILGRDPRSKGQRSGRGHSRPGRRLTSFSCGTGARPRLSPLPEPELFPMYCFISGPADKCSSIPRGGREVLNNGPVSPRPRSAL